jgi:ectoine hydroxylase-related dioxygenase (phytanoyl-CoA dioxygenase family)
MDRARWEQAAPSRRLTPAQVAAFRRDGYLFPMRALSAAEAQRYRTRLEAFEASHGGPLSSSFRTKPHLVFAWVAELVRHPTILDAVEDLLGPDLLVWSSGFFLKEARDPSFVSWHQDSTYWGLSEPDVVTAWLALSVSNPANGCMRVVPGSHLRDQIPHRDTFASHNLLSRGKEVMVEVREADAVPLGLSPGEFSLHHVRMVHGSEPNRSDHRRLGLAIRYIPTRLRQTAGPHDSATLVRGIDRYGHFELEPTPTADLDADVLAFHDRVVERGKQILYRPVEWESRG